MRTFALLIKQSSGTQLFWVLTLFTFVSSLSFASTVSVTNNPEWKRSKNAFVAKDEVLIPALTKALSPSSPEFRVELMDCIMEDAAYHYPRNDRSDLYGVNVVLYHPTTGRQIKTAFGGRLDELDIALNVSFSLFGERSTRGSAIAKDILTLQKPTLTTTADLAERWLVLREMSKGVYRLSGITFALDNLSGPYVVSAYSVLGTVKDPRFHIRGVDTCYSRK